MPLKQFPLGVEPSSPVVLDIIYRLKIRDVMYPQVVTAAEDTPLLRIKALMKTENVTGIPIVRGERVLGIVSIDDILSAIDAGAMSKTAADRMTTTVIVLEDDMPLSFGIRYFDKFKYGRFPVIDTHKRLVGILSSRDILTSLLTEMNRELQQLEKQLPVSEEKATDTELRQRYSIRKNDFEHAGRASNEIKKCLVERQVAKADIRRVAVATYELEINMTIHSEGGVLDVIVNPEGAVVTARDLAPGIDDVDQALREGFSTANDEIKALGFGAGLGLPNVKRVADRFDIQSALGSGTMVRADIFFQQEKSA